MEILIGAFILIPIVILIFIKKINQYLIKSDKFDKSISTTIDKYTKWVNINFIFIGFGIGAVVVLIVFIIEPYMILVVIGSVLAVLILFMVIGFIYQIFFNRD